LSDEPASLPVHHPTGEIPRQEVIADLSKLSAEELLPVIYEQLRNLARHYMSGERQDHTLQTTALVHEAYVRLAGSSQVDWHNQRQFFHAAAEAMRRILIDRGRQRRQLKRGGGPAGPARKIPLSAVDPAFENDPDRILAVDEAILRLEQKDPEVAKIVRLRFYAGLSVEETAQVLGVSQRTVMREWTYARAWLFRELGNEA